LNSRPEDFKFTISQQARLRQGEKCRLMVS
jgi:hypothetical protein